MCRRDVLFKKKPNPTPWAICAVLGFLLAGLSAHAASVSWLGGSTTNLAAANWTGNTTTTSGDSWTFNNAPGQTLTNDLTAGFTVAGITFGTSAYTLNGNALTLTGGITNNSTLTQTISNNLTINSSIVFTNILNTGSPYITQRGGLS